MRRFVADVAVVGALVFAGGGAALGASLTLPLDAEKLAAFIAANDVRTVEDLLAALPESLQESFVLMSSSRSLHRATPRQPRQILFGADARFLIAVSGVPDDPRYNLVEFAEFEPRQGAYRFGTVDFNAGGRVETGQTLCESCHGRPARPIWGQYPTWPGAYADNEGRIDPASKADFAAFAAAAPQAPRYRGLRFAAGEGGATFLLTGRRYPYANTDFNHELGNTVALGTATRMRAHPDYARYFWAALAASPALSCIDSDAWSDLTRLINAAYAAIAARYPATSRPSVKAQRLLGVDPAPELSLEKLAAEAVSGTAGYWQTGAFRIDEAVAYQLLQDAMAADAEMRAAFAPQQKAIDYIARYLALVGTERSEALRRSYGWFPFFDVFDPVVDDQATLDRVCGRLAERLSVRPSLRPY
jgi:hypothetical protein